MSEQRPASPCCVHVWSNLQCDHREHYYICARKDCTTRQYFSKCTCAKWLPHDHPDAGPRADRYPFGDPQ